MSRRRSSRTQGTRIRHGADQNITHCFLAAQRVQQQERSVASRVLPKKRTKSFLLYIFL